MEIARGLNREDRPLGENGREALLALQKQGASTNAERRELNLDIRAVPDDDLETARLQLAGEFLPVQKSQGLLVLEKGRLGGRNFKFYKHMCQGGEM